MGVNMVGNCISDDEVCCEASKQEIIRRYYAALCDFASGKSSDNEVNKIALLMKQAKITTADRRTTTAAKERKEQTGVASAAIELADGTIITAKTSPLLGPSAALILNATKYLAGIGHDVKLIPQEMIEPIQKTKVNLLHGHNPRLHTDEVLVALSILSPNDENCRKALACLPQFDGCQVHATVMLSEVDRKIFKKLGIGLTCEPVIKNSFSRQNADYCSNAKDYQTYIHKTALPSSPASTHVWGDDWDMMIFILVIYDIFTHS